MVAPALALSVELERGILIGTVLVAAVFVSRGIRIHYQRAVVAPVAAGALTWILGEVVGGHGSALPALHGIGGLLMAAGLAWNAWLRHHAGCPECGCPHAELSEDARPLRRKSTAA
jgi:hypothetical protein